MPVVTLTSDFGTADGYVAAMKGVILGLTPEVRLVDVSHAVPAQDVRHAAYVIYSIYRYFPPGSTHLCVVDPGVGGSRRAIAIQTQRGIFVGPDNGLFSYVLALEPSATVVELDAASVAPQGVSHTFHGRDLFAPAAARLAGGVPIGELGVPAVDPLTFRPRLEVHARALSGEVLHVDGFGNAVTSIALLRWHQGAVGLRPAPWADVGDTTALGDARRGTSELFFPPREAAVIVAGRRLVGVQRTYSEVAPGAALTLIGSSGHLEIAVREGNAADALGIRRGAEVRVLYEDSDAPVQSARNATPNADGKEGPWPSS